MAFPLPSLWRNLPHFVLCVIFVMHPLCSHLLVVGMPWGRDAAWECLLGCASCLGFKAQSRGWLRLGRVNLQPSFQVGRKVGKSGLIEMQ